MTRELFEEYDLTVAELNKENQELKLELSGYRQAILNNKKMLSLKEQNKQLKEQLLVIQTNEETFRLEMKDITQTLGLDENTLFDDVKVYVRNLKDNWNELKKLFYQKYYNGERIDIKDILDKMQELEQGSDSNE